MSEKFSLKWNDYQTNWTRSLLESRNDTDFADVTLITDDKVKFPAHKLLLSSCSNMFKFILKRSNQYNSLLYLGGVSSVNLGFILDYIYCGEVNLLQEQLDSFLESAQKLEVEGLLGSDNQQEEKDPNILDSQFEESNHYKEEEETQVVNINKNTTSKTRRQYPRPSSNITSTDVPKYDVRSMTSEEIEKKTEELYERKEGGSACLICDYTTPFTNNTIKKHIETHFDGLSYTYKFCSKEVRSKNMLYKHVMLCNLRK